MVACSQTSAAGVLALLSEPEPLFKQHALKVFNPLVRQPSCSAILGRNFRAHCRHVRPFPLYCFPTSFLTVILLQRITVREQ